MRTLVLAALGLALIALGPPPDALCKARIPQCTACTNSVEAGAWQCSACDPYSILDTTNGYFNSEEGRFEDEPFCDGLCMYYRTNAIRLEDGTLPCISCTGSLGCGGCKAGSFKAPDTYAQYIYRLPSSTPTTCSTCGVCEDNKCSSQGCTQCLAGATPMLVAGTTQLKDPQYCITEYCDEVMPGMPQNPNLYSYYPACAAVEGQAQCSPTAGCTACPSGSFLVRNPLVPTAARCQRCEGCPASLCGTAGCASCPIKGLGTRTEVLNATTPAGGKVYACKNATASVTAFRGADVLPPTATWPASEFGGCGVDEMGGVGDFMFLWYSSKGAGVSSDPNADLTIASWSALPDDVAGRVAGTTNTTTSLAFQFLTSTRVVIKLTTADVRTRQEVTRTVYHVLPKAQDRVCITFGNYVTSDAEDADMAAQVSVVNTSGKKVLLRLSGYRSLTPRVDATFGDTLFPGGGVSVFGRNGALLASPAAGVKWASLAAENLVILPSEAEWPDLV